MLILSGQIGQKLDGSIPKDSLEQLAVAWENLHRNLKAAKMDVIDLVKITTYVVGKMDVTRRRALFSAQLKGHKPCMTMVFVVALASPLYKEELDAWASRAGSGVSVDASWYCHWNAARRGGARFSAATEGGVPFPAHCELLCLRTGVPKESSVRSVLSIAAHQPERASSVGAASRARVASDGAWITSGTGFYKQDVPNGASLATHRK